MKNNNNDGIRTQKKKSTHAFLEQWKTGLMSLLKNGKKWEKSLNKGKCIKNAICCGMNNEQMAGSCVNNIELCASTRKNHHPFDIRLTMVIRHSKNKWIIFKWMRRVRTQSEQKQERERNKKRQTKLVISICVAVNY